MWAYVHLPQAAKLVVHERETILAALEDMPPELTELRGVLLLELAWLRSEGSCRRIEGSRPDRGPLTRQSPHSDEPPRAIRHARRARTLDASQVCRKTPSVET